MPPNSTANYLNSPVAKHALVDGSLDSNKDFTRINNRKLKMKDSFGTIFPTYNHEATSAIKDKVVRMQYEQTDLLGNPTHNISREFTHKKDQIKNYADSMAQVQSMRRVYKA